MNLPPLSLYIHIPWCVRKCPYCDFNSHAVKSDLPEQAYVAALLSDLKADSSYISARKLNSIFIGGGTPSLFSADAVATLLQGIAQQIELTESIEITLEANPGAVDSRAFAGYREAGVNRLSLGIQSLQASALSALGRIHSPEEAIDGVSLARKAGFDNINIDMMFGLPQQTPEMARQDLLAAIDLNSEHLSYYQLTLEPNTSFYHNPPPLPEEDHLWQIQQQGEEILAEAGFEHYEVSAFARPDAQCCHNYNYWRFGDYLGIGAGAHAKLTLPGGQVKRFWKHRHPEAYLAAAEAEDFTQGQRYLDQDDLILEFMMNALRLYQGVEVDLFEAHSGIGLAEIEGLLSHAVDKGLLLPVEQRLCATDLGRRFLNDLITHFSN
ncbi:MAG: radical SAM family heme chaperone HemW [Candidatus Thiodiazotropha sp. 6PLUC3]